MTNNILITIGRSEEVGLPERNLNSIPARIDTGAKTSSIWVTNVHEHDGKLEFYLFGTKSTYFTGELITAKHFEKRMIASSNGELQERYVVKLLVDLAGKKIRASFTLADRSGQVYPVLIGRNILRGKFLVDVKIGKPLTDQEKKHSRALQARLSTKEII